MRLKPIHHLFQAFYFPVRIHEAAGLSCTIISTVTAADFVSLEAT
ncbi:unnamed protein product, partial [Larinioides sclopetarius]